MTPRELLRRFPSASKECQRLNSEAVSGQPELSVAMRAGYHQERAVSPASASEAHFPCRAPETTVAQTSGIVVTIPVPDRHLGPNGDKLHWAKRSKLVKEAKRTAMFAGLAALKTTHQPKWDRATIQVRWYHKTGHRLDSDNAISRLKGSCDGLTEAGIFSDDRGVVWLPVLQFTDRANPRVELHITPD